MQSLNEFIVTATAQPGLEPDMALKAAQRKAWEKRYNMAFTFVTTETDGNEGHFNAVANWTGVSYGVMLATEKEMVGLLKKFTDLGGAVASGEVPPETPPEV